MFYLVYLCFDAILNLLFNFLFLCKTLVFIFLEFERPKYQSQISSKSASVYVKVFVKIVFLWILVTSKIHYQNRSLFENTYSKCGAGLQPGTYFTWSFIFQDSVYKLGTPIFRNTWKCLFGGFLTSIFKQKFTVSLFASLENETSKLVILMVIDKFTIMEFTMLTRNLSFLVPPSRSQNTFMKFPWFSEKYIADLPWLVAFLILFWFTSLNHRYYGESFCHSLNEAVEDRKKGVRVGGGEKSRKIWYHSYMQWVTPPYYSQSFHLLHLDFPPSCYHYLN